MVLHCRRLSLLPCVCAGEFAEAVRDQFMTERQEQLAQLEQAVLDATLQSPECNCDQLAHALMAMDPELLEAQACLSYAHARNLSLRFHRIRCTQAGIQKLSPGHQQMMKLGHGQGCRGPLPAQPAGM